MRLRAGELTEERTTMEAHVSGCEHCRAILSELDAAEARLFELSEPVSASVQLSSRPAPRARRMGVLVFASVAASTALAIAVLAPPLEPYTGTKGGRSADGTTPSIELFAKTSGGVIQVDESTSLVEGDAVQLRVRGGGSTRIVVLSVDGARKVSSWYPSDDTHPSVLIPPNRLDTLEGSILLDEAVGAETVIAIFGDETLDAGKLRTQLTELLETHPGDSWTTALDALPGVVLTQRFLKMVAIP
ncbi:MAG: hypothetical protein HYV07_06775 [Deltaproteobacteria bacterium]|nr:hypothetical protein [Deltaproteobacteria bacterium]